jgi:hypothetical protein
MKLISLLLLDEFKYLGRNLMAFTEGKDLNVLQASDTAVLGAGKGDDKYVLTPAGLTAGQSITISDALGDNTLQLIGGLTIASSKVSANAIQLTLSNGAIVNILGSDAFKFEIGGNPLIGTPGTIQNFTQFVTTSLGLAAVPTGSVVADGSTNVAVRDDGTTTSGGTTTPGTTTFALTAAATSMTEGSTLGYTVTASQNVTVDTVVAFTLVAGDTAAANQGTGTTNQSDFAAAAFNTQNVTILAGTKTAVFNVSSLADSDTELTETFSVKAVVAGTTLTTTTTLQNTDSTGSTFTLTSGTDAMPGLIGSNGTSSTAGDNVISATIGSTNETTLNSSDNLNAGPGADILNVRIASLNANVSVAPVLTSVETLSIANVDTSFISVEINLTSASDVKTVEFKNTSAQSNITVVNASASAAIVLDNADGSSVGQNVNLGSNAGRTGSADAFAIKIANGSGSSSLAAGFNLVNNDRTNDTSFETANMTVAGTRSFIVVGEAMDGLTTVNVTGETTDTTPGFGLSLSQVNGFDKLKTVDASGMTGGGLDLDAIGSTATGFTFTGSTAADTLFVSKATLDASGALDGGSGKDILMTTSFNVATAVNRATGFEVLQANTPSSLDASSFTGINEFLFTGNTSGRLNITGVESNDRFVLASDISGDPALRFTGKNAGSSVVFEMRASAATNGEATIISNSNSGNDASAIDFQKISSVTIDSTGTNTKANLIEAVRTGNYDFYAFDNNNGLSNFRITGSQNLTIEAKEGVDLSANSRTFGFTNAVNVDASSFNGVLRIAGSRSDDVIDGGNGNDIIYGLGGSDTLTGNGGSDQFRMVGSSGTDIIKDFATGVDKIGTNNLDFANTTATSAGATLSAQDYVDNRAGINAIGTGDDKKVIELQSALSTTQIQADTGGTAAAYVLVFNSTTNKGELWFDANWSDGNSRSQVATFDNVTNLAELTGFKNTDFVEFIA